MRSGPTGGPVERYTTEEIGERDGPGVQQHFHGDPDEQLAVVLRGAQQPGRGGIVERLAQRMVLARTGRAPARTCAG
jgi:hypothetical protein